MYIFIFLAGISFGSFLNVLIYRIPKDISIITPMSYCDNCKRKLTILEKLPLISFLIYRKCKCGYKIPIYYPVNESLCGIMCVIFYYFFHFNGFAYFLIFLLFYCISFIDYIYLKIPSSINFIILAISILLTIDHATIIDSIYNSLIFMGLISFIKILLESILDKEVIGEGDIIVFGTIGAFFDDTSGAICIFLSSLYALIFLLYKKSNIAPFVPFLFLGFFSVFFVKYIL